MLYQDSQIERNHGNGDMLDITNEFNVETMETPSLIEQLL